MMLGLSPQGCDTPTALLKSVNAVFINGAWCMQFIHNLHCVQGKWKHVLFLLHLERGSVDFVMYTCYIQHMHLLHAEKGLTLACTYFACTFLYFIEFKKNFHSLSKLLVCCCPLSQIKRVPINSSLEIKLVLLRCV